MAMRRSLPSLRPLASAWSLSVSRGGRLTPACLEGSCSPAFAPVGALRSVGGSSGGGGRGRDWRVLLPAGGRLQGTGVRRFGVMESMQNKIINRSVAKQEKQFKEQMEELSLKESFDLDDFAKIIEEPLDKFSAKLPWNKNREDMQTMMAQKKVLEGFTPLQRKQPDSIRPGHREAVAARAGVTIEDVHATLSAYRHQKAMHAWLSTRRKRKEKIPTSQEELQVMATDPSGTTLIKFMKIKRSKSGNPRLAF